MTQAERERERKVALLYSCGLRDFEIAPLVGVINSSSIGRIRKRIGLEPDNLELREKGLLDTNGVRMTDSRIIEDAKRRLERMELKAGAE